MRGDGRRSAASPPTLTDRARGPVPHRRSPAVDDTPTTYLKLHVEDPSQSAAPPLDDFVGLTELCDSFEQATGYALQYLPDKVGTVPMDSVWSCEIPAVEDPSPGRLVLEKGNEQEESARTADRMEETQQLVATVAELLGELHRSRQTVWRQAAELATAIPVAGHPHEEEHLAKRLEAVLKGGAEAIGCQAAALYLLDDATTELKLRSSWGLPQDRLLRSDRPLREAIADVEALAGHAIVMEDTRLLPHWRCPESFASAVCVPVASPVMELGTLWIFCDRVRDFTDQETNLVEIIAGRLAADLEREVLLREGVAARQSDRNIDDIVKQQNDQLPQITPLVEGWQVAGRTEHAGEVGGDFHDWFVLPDGRLALAAGNAQGSPLAAAMTAATVGAALKAHSNYRHAAGDMIERVGETLWESGTGDRFASLLYTAIDPEGDQAEIAQAGRAGILMLRSDGWQQIDLDGEPMGTDPEPAGTTSRLDFRRGDTLVMVTEGFLRQLAGSSRRTKLDSLGKALREHREASAERLVEIAIQFAARHESAGPGRDRTVLVVKRG
jgi:sigma-B regulation protein RsbU (phosphoserine phosphatase)